MSTSSPTELPEYASLKYQNTCELLNHAERINHSIEQNRLQLSKKERQMFMRSHQSLLLKSQVLGYLEDVTEGAIHLDPMDSSDGRMHIAHLLSDDDPSHLGLPERAETRLKWFRNFVAKAPDKDVAEQEILRAFYLESKPAMDIDDVENLVLAGGGAKALSLAGALRSLEKEGRSEQIKRVAGTSGGAIMAMGYAAGYSADELCDVVNDNEFGLFTLNSRADNKVLNQWAHWFHRGSKEDKLHVLSDNKQAHVYHRQLMSELAGVVLNHDDTRLKKMRHKLEAAHQGTSLSSPEKRRESLGDALSELLIQQPNKEVLFSGIMSVIGDDEIIEIDKRAHHETSMEVEILGAFSQSVLYSSPKKALVNAMRHRTGQDLVRGFFSDLLYAKLKEEPVENLRVAFYGDSARHDPTKRVNESQLREINFSQMQTLHEIAPERYRELRISICVKRPLKERLENGKYVRYDHEDVAYDNPEFSKMTVVDAVRVSMNLPGIYQAYKFNVKNKHYEGADGGVLSNVSLSSFDLERDGKTQKFRPEQTIGVFYKTAEELKSAHDVNRMLVLPRSAKEIRSDIKMLTFDQQFQQDEMDRVEHSLADATPGMIPNDELINLATEYNEAKDLYNSDGGRLSALKSELNAIERNVFTTPYHWLKSPLGEVGRVLYGYLDSKSKDILGTSDNLRRLVMVNTGEVSTMDFKLSATEKSMQLNFGEKAMGSLIDGTYCLENHFHHHQFKELTTEYVGKAMTKMVDDAAPYVVPDEPDIVYAMPLDQEELDQQIVRRPPG
jgi:predicted acylesterase/phospholipase RssA